MAFGETQPATSAAVSDFTEHGRHILPAPVDAEAAAALLAEIRADRSFGQALFLDQASFEANPQYTGVNPRPGRNLLDRFADRLGFVEGSPMVTGALDALLGQGWEVLNRKIVCGVPQSAIPGWVKDKIGDDLVNNLGPYVRPEYRDVTYFYGIDFHQDLIDFKDRDADFVTLYCYLHPVTRADAPLYLLDGSHALGATVFPHDLRRDGEAWLYGDRAGQEVACAQRILTGETGFVAIWHACTLHGTQPDAADHERISLRYLIAKRPGTKAAIDDLNAALKGPARLASTRLDLAADGSPQIKGNTVNRA
ncbi:hypothetical protein [Phenylobacterium montanum]|uniref:Phytanoyl-CoA dioxygenase family protein n=1 Tax=Phenylobacterium montanum TaxID=2823693 RepID=A0A975G2R9_9CAUL|nr:hypothetical protein [Caulobacter sp. S6]QUD89719.1 hypothetical protein KCG34_07565 [Caulobacter sp. S6]